MVPPASQRVPRVHWYSGSCCPLLAFTYTALTFCGCPSHDILLTIRVTSAVLNPTYIAIYGLASFPFARRYLGNRCFFLFLPLLRCFSSRRSPCKAMDLPYSDWAFPSRVSPFRYPRIKAYVQLPVAFRSLSRLSSAPGAKAFALCSFLLDLL